MDNFKLCVEKTIFFEDETETGVFTNDPRDPGGATRWGITLKTLERFLGRKCSPKDVEKLSRNAAISIYAANYWGVMACQNLPHGVDFMVFDFGVNAGCERSVKTLQKIIGVRSDGICGPITQGASYGYPSEQLVRLLADAQEEHYRNLSTFATFGSGWMRRLGNRRRAAMSLANTEGKSIIS